MRGRIADSWERRLQRVRMRTKIVVPMLLLAVGPALAIGSFMIHRGREALQESVGRRVEFDAASKARAIQDFLARVAEDVRFLSQTKAIRELVSADPDRDSARFQALRSQLEQDLLFFQRGHPYCEAQCLNPLGQQLIRIDAKGGVLPVMTSQPPVDASEPFDMSPALVLEPGQVYVSPMHLDVVHGMVGAVMKYATPVLGDGQRSRGLLVVGVCAEHILSMIGPLPGGMEAWLVDGAGNYLGYVGGSEQKRALFSLEKRRLLSSEFSADEVLALLNADRSRLPVQTSAAEIFSAPITIEADGAAQHWSLLISYPRGPIAAPIRHLTILLSIVMLVVMALAGLLGILMSHYLARPIASLRRATHEIAAGDLSKRVEITTGDEIEALASDFNIMTERLRQAQEQLADWNVQLEQEVERQTDKVRELQTGLARADKLASIGQITAGVMHEIGNPLAAIKTKIQVAEEAGDLDTDPRALLNEILVEVNRLAAFLRSFSRLAKLREKPVKEQVSLITVAQSVVSLLASDLRRRRVVTRVEGERDTPSICGDVEQIRHLFMNLILNAADASPNGGEVLIKTQGHASHRRDGTAPEAMVAIVDAGTGIDPAVLEKIWNPFFTTKPDGTGLGLAICRQIVQEHGGTIQLHSKVGVGTVVTITFPGCAPAMDPMAPVQPRGELVLN